MLGGSQTGDPRMDDRTTPLELATSVPEKDTIAIELVREALLQSGLNPEARAHLLARVGIGPDLLAQAGARVPATAYAALWRDLAQATDDEFFGMDPRGLRYGSLAFLCRSSMAQPTVASGLESGLGFLSLMLECFSARLIRRNSVAEIVLDEGDATQRRAFCYFTYWMIVHGVTCWLSGRRIPILAIELRCEAPAFIDDYQVMFTENLRFERPCSRMIFPSECLDLPIRRSQDDLQRFMAAAPANILVKYRDPQSLASRIRHDLRTRPADQWPDTEDLAKNLCLSASTLRRRLAEQGHSYQGLKDGVRKELAIRWLGEERMSLSAIAARLGFADTSSFYKAFRKWTGSNPGHYRSVALLSIDQTSHPD
jgi:AraC-like DNA-binding protein